MAPIPKRAGANQFRRDAIFKPGAAPTFEMFPHHFRGNLAEVVTKIGDQFVEIFQRAMAGLQTVIHGDYRIDNSKLLLLSTVKPRLLQWIGRTPPACDHTIGLFRLPKL